MTTNQALIDALRERAAKIVPLAQAPDLLQLAQVATLCTQAEDLVSAEHRNQSMESARQDADPLRKFGSALDQPPGAAGLIRDVLLTAIWPPVKHRNPRGRGQLRPGCGRSHPDYRESSPEKVGSAGRF